MRVRPDPSPDLLACMARNPEFAERVRRLISEPERVPLSGLQLSGWTTSALDDAGIVTLGDLSCWSAAELLRLPGFGRRSLEVVRALLDDFGLCLSANPMWVPGPRGQRRPAWETDFQRERRLRDEKIQALFDNGVHPAQIAKQAGMTRTNVYNILKARREKLKANIAR